MPGTRLYSEQGTLRSEDHQVRSVARSRINSALTDLGRKYDALAAQLVLKTEFAFFTDAGDIITRVRAHSWLKDELATLDRYTDSFPEMQSYVDGQLTRIELRTHRLVARRVYRPLH